MKKWFVLVFGVSAFGLNVATVFADSKVIPSIYQGDWSGNLEYCGRDSDQNWSIKESIINAWEMHYEIKNVISFEEKKMIIDVIHKEYEYEEHTKINLLLEAKDVLRVENICGKEICWRTKLYRCPSVSFQE